MNVKTYSHARQNFAKLMDEAADSRAPIMVTRRGAESIVILPIGEYEAMEETFHLMRSPKNAARLLESIKQAEAGKLISRDPTKRRAKRR